MGVARTLLAALLVLCTISYVQAYNITCANTNDSLFSHSVTDLNGMTVPLTQYSGKVVIVVNVATY